MYGGPLFSTLFKKNLRIQNDQKLITDFSIYECLHLTGPEVNFSFDVWKILELFHFISSEIVTSAEREVFATLRNVSKLIFLARLGTQSL